MSGKHNKRIRREAEREKLGLPPADYRMTGTGAIMLRPNCVKAIYKRMRNQQRKAK